MKWVDVFLFFTITHVYFVCFTIYTFQNNYKTYIQNRSIYRNTTQVQTYTHQFKCEFSKLYYRIYVGQYRNRVLSRRRCVSIFILYITTGRK